MGDGAGGGLPERGLGHLPAMGRAWRAGPRKGEKSSPVVFWKISDKEEQDGAEDGSEDGRRFRVFARGYAVFNAAQVDGYAAAALPVLPEAERIGHAEAFFAATGIDVRHGGNRAYYRPSEDRVQMPPFEAFRDAVAYYATLAHEATHATGHPSRCARDLKGRFGEEAYAAEELIALSIRDEGVSPERQASQ